ncbi:MAG: DUF3786 domain-containing protein [Eubacteriaceae bacterium]|nr:DUF3786 domain-containing protein [Eubacteriaceae bacterium]
MATNHEKMRDEMSLRFLESDQEEIIRAFSLGCDSGYIFLSFLGDDMRIVRSSGTVEVSENGRWIPAGFDDSMCVYDLLSFSREPVAVSGEYVNLRSLSALSGAAFSPAGNSFFSKQEERLTGKAVRLGEIFASRGWQACEGADAACVIPVFGDLKLMLRFWDADEDFPASLQFMWDRSVLKMMHYETVWFASSAVVRRIMSDI